MRTAVLGLLGLVLAVDRRPRRPPVDARHDLAARRPPRAGARARASGSDNDESHDQRAHRYGDAVNTEHHERLDPDGRRQLGPGTGERRLSATTPAATAAVAAATTKPRVGSHDGVDGLPDPVLDERGAGRARARAQGGGRRLGRCRSRRPQPRGRDQRPGPYPSSRRRPRPARLAAHTSISRSVSRSRRSSRPTPRAAGAEELLDWFNQVWKLPPNLIAAEELKPTSDRELIAELAGRIEARSTDSRRSSPGVPSSSATG